MRAKFKVISETRSVWQSGFSVTLQPVTGNSGEDKSFWDATPNGKLEMAITNPAAVGFFEIGKSYYLDFTEAPDTVPE